MNENKLRTSLMRCVICGLGCRNHHDKAEGSKNGVFVGPHTQNSKNQWNFFRDARFCSKFEEIRYSLVGSNEEGMYKLI